MKTKERQTKLKHFVWEDLQPVSAAEFVEGINLAEITKELILPPYEINAKFSLRDYLTIIIFHFVKGYKTRSKTIKKLEEDAHQRTALGLKAVPSIASLNRFIRCVIGPEVYEELWQRVNATKHGQQQFILDNISEHNAPRNHTRINGKKRRALVKDVIDVLTTHVKENSAINSNYSDKKIVSVIVHMMAHNGHSAHSYGQSFRASEQGDYRREQIPTGRTILNRIRQMYGSEQEILAFQSDMLKRTVSIIRRNHPKFFNRTTVNLAIDKTSIPTWERYDKSPNPADIIHDAHQLQKGTQYFRQYMTCTIIVDGYRFTIGFIPIDQTRTSRIHLQVEKLLLLAKSHFKIGIVTMDKEFETGDLLQMLNEMNIKYICPTKRTASNMKIARTANEDISHQDRIIKGRKVGTMLIVKTPKDFLEDDIMLYTTNLEITSSTIPVIQEMYRKRWGIETGYNEINFFRAFTCSRDTLIRTFYYGAAIILYNLYVLANLVAIILYMKTIPARPPIPKKQFATLIWCTKEPPQKK